MVAAIRLCGDYQVTVNQASKVDHYQLLGWKSYVFASMAGGKVFTKLDMFQAYLQFPLDDKSAEPVTYIPSTPIKAFSGTVQSNYNFTLTRIITCVHAWLHGKNCHAPHYVAACATATALSRVSMRGN